MNETNRQAVITMTSMKKAVGLHFTTHADEGKLAGMHSLSTSCLRNALCMKRMKTLKDRHGNPCICPYCFSASQQMRQAGTRAALERNYDILTTRLFEVDELPILNELVFRIESFGDAANETQVRNYIRLAKRNPRTTVTAWTKNPGIWKRAIDIEGKPKNMILILSSLFMNVRAEPSPYPFVDKVFTVYENEEKAKECGAVINCGTRKCLACQACYRKGGVKYINEILK